MAMPNEPTKISGVIGENADTNTIPDSSTTALNYDTGLPSAVSSPIMPGGKPIDRKDLNAVHKLLSEHVYWQQSGGVYTWDSALDYPVGAHVRGSDGTEYRSVAENGPDTDAGTQDPTSSTGYWVQADTTYTAGENVQIDGTTISATDTTYTAGTNVQINGTVISATDTTYTAGDGLSLSGTQFSVDTSWLESKFVYDLGTMD